MKRKHLSLAIGCILLAPSAWAQESAPAEASSDATTLDRITLTARKREETIQEVPIAVTAFTPETLDKLNIQDLADLDAQVPNLTIYA
ncbi:MAG: TonB-dependent receptor, partial [Pseudoxanthomonas sp.]